MPSIADHDNVSLVIIGCGTPSPTPERFGSCFVLKVGDECLMFDCGPASTYKMVALGMAPTDIHHLFFTHHHFDHNVDYPCFLLSRWNHELPDMPLLKVYGPPPIRLITEKLIGPEGAFADDWRARVEHPASQAVYVARGGQLPRPKPWYDVTEIKAGDHIETEHCRVTAGHAVHLQPFLQCLCYRIEWAGGSIVISGDAGRDSGLVDFARGADTIVVNVWDHQTNMSVTLLSGFCGTLDAADLARSAGAKRLILAHQGPNITRPGSMERAIADMALVFSGELVFGEEFMQVDLESI